MNVGVGAGDGFMDADHQELRDKVEGYFPIGVNAAKIGGEQPVIPSTADAAIETVDSSVACAPESSAATAPRP